MTLIKFCGIKRLEDARRAIELGVGALGFNFYSKSPRFVALPEAQTIVRALPPKAWFVGVFVNEDAKQVQQIARLVGLDTLQFHGNEPREYVTKWKSYRVLKAIRASDQECINKIYEYQDAVDFIVLDAYNRDYFGGTGTQVNEEILNMLLNQNLFKSIILSGGLTADNVSEKITRYKPFGVDVASGIEQAPGIKGADLMQRFVKAAHNL